MLFFTCSFIFRDDLIMTNGTIGGAWIMSVSLYTAVLATVLWKAALITE
jgi:phospholipid-transporting ATPase